MEAIQKQRRVKSFSTPLPLLHLGKSLLILLDAKNVHLKINQKIKRPKKSIKQPPQKINQTTTKNIKRPKELIKPPHPSLHFSQLALSFCPAPATFIIIIIFLIFIIIVVLININDDFVLDIVIIMQSVSSTFLIMAKNSLSAFTIGSSTFDCFHI